MIWFLIWIIIGLATFFFGWKSVDEGMEHGVGSYNHISYHERRIVLKLFLLTCLILGPLMVVKLIVYLIKENK